MQDENIREKIPEDTLVSVIVPVYNVAPYLEEAIESVVHQTYTNLEIIIVDDGSTDGSGEICDRYAGEDKRIRVIHQENKGLSAARNAGLDRMTGDAVAFLDSDDAYAPDFVEKTTDLMRRENADLVVARHSIHETIGGMTEQNCIKESPYIRKGMYDRTGALRGLADGTVRHAAWNKLYRIELWKDLRYPVGHIYEDVDTTYRILNRCDRVYAIDMVLYRYRKHSGTITKTYSKENIQDNILAHAHYFSFVYENIPNVFSEEQVKKLQQSRVVEMCSDYIHLSWGEDGVFREELRERIIETGREVGIGNCSFRMKVCYRMICYCPWMVRILYPVYCWVR